MAMTFPAHAAVVTFLNAPSVPRDTVNWAQLGTDGTAIAQTFSATSGSGVLVSSNLAGAGGLTSVVCDPANPANCSWAPPAPGYSIGDSLIWAENAAGTGSGPFTFSFATQYGVGVFIQSVSAGQFSAQLQIFNSGGLLGSQIYTSDAAGDPLFLGAADTTKEITKAVVGTTACSAFACDPNDFSADSLQFFSAPEPSTLVLWAGALLVWGAWRVRRAVPAKTRL